MKSKRYNEGGDVDPLEEYNKSEGIAVEPGPKAEPEPEKPKAAKPRPKPVAKAAAPAKPAPAAAEPPKAKSEGYKGLPTAAERFSEIRKKLSDAEAENVRKRNERAESSKKSFGDFMKGVKRRFGTQAMRDEANMKSGGSVKGYTKGGSVRGGGCEQRGKTKGRFV
jgi:hypothetical protein